MIDLKELAGGRYRLAEDESATIPGQTLEDRAWLTQIPGKFGHVYIHGVATLGAYVRTYNDGSNRLGRLLAIPGAKLRQRGDREASITFPPEGLEAVAGILRLKTRQRLSEDHRRRLIEAGAVHRFPARDKRACVGPQDDD